ncbi:MAG: C40 family peptidase [Deltaproteobacteria bacterium]|nr:C40 family peptidase [Deltaproteobacteria bacterium]
MRTYSTILAICFVITLLLFNSTALAVNVTSDANRKQSLIEYIEHRDDLNSSERQKWQKQIRLIFGGKAIKDGSNEGVTAAKSVIAAAIFYDIEYKQAINSAYDAYHDVHRWVPLPIAVLYQVLSFSGHKPKASPREMAFNFPRHFDEDIAPELVTWWSEKLAVNSIPKTKIHQVKKALKETRELMKPMLRDRLWQAAQYEAQINTKNAKTTAFRKNLSILSEEINRDYKEVSNNNIVNDKNRSYYERYGAICSELKEKPHELPIIPRQEIKTTPVKQKPNQNIQTTSKQPTKTSVNDSPSPQMQDKIVSITDNVNTPKNWPTPLVAATKGWLGTPYLWGGASKKGVDCSGFSQSVYREGATYNLPRSSGAQYTIGVPVSKNQLKTGDLVFFDTLDRGRVTHVGIYIGNGQIVHASSSKGVTHADFSKQYYQRAYLGARRVF